MTQKQAESDNTCSVNVCAAKDVLPSTEQEGLEFTTPRLASSHQTMLERAIASTHRIRNVHPIGDEEIAVALAWIHSDISLRQATTAFYPDANHPNKIGGRVLYRIATCLREAYRQGLLVEPKA